jgi:hypothetical protein
MAMQMKVVWFLQLSTTRQNVSQVIYGHKLTFIVLSIIIIGQVI